MIFNIVFITTSTTTLRLELVVALLLFNFTTTTTCFTMFLSLQRILFSSTIFSIIEPAERESRRAPNLAEMHAKWLAEGFQN